jgi:putative Mn2+ efflux pump MntP
MVLLMTWLSISLDSLSVGVALPAAAVPLMPLLIALSFTTIVFARIGVRFLAASATKAEPGSQQVLCSSS